MPERLDRRLSALEEKSRGDMPRLIVFNARTDGDYDQWRSENVVPLEVKGHRPLVVKIRHLSTDISHQGL